MIEITNYNGCDFMCISNNREHVKLVKKQGFTTDDNINWDILFPGIHYDMITSFIDMTDYDSKIFIDIVYISTKLDDDKLLYFFDHFIEDDDDEESNESEEDISNITTQEYEDMSENEYENLFGTCTSRNTSMTDEDVSENLYQVDPRDNILDEVKEQDSDDSDDY